MPSKVPVFAKKKNYRCIFERRRKFSRSCRNIEREFEHGKRCQKFDDEKKEKAADILGENPLITLKCMNERLR